MAKRLTLEGGVVRGVGAGRRFMSHPYYVNEFEKLLGCKPYPGTVNLVTEVDWRLLASKCRPTVIPGTVYGGQELGAVYVWKGVIVKPEPLSGVEVALVRPLKSIHPPEVLELVSCIELGRAASEGSSISLEISCLEEPPYVKPPRLPKR